MIGDILSASIDSTGWYIDILVEGLSTGGTYDLNYGQYNDPTNCNLILSVTSESFDTSGDATTTVRTIYGTKFKRQAYPNEALADETISGSDVFIRVALSEWVYTNDSSILVNISSGLYTENSTPTNSTSGLSVTNNSTQTYFKTIANWTIYNHGKRLGYNELLSLNDDTGVYELRARAVNRHGISCVKFTMTGRTSGHIENLVVNQTSIDMDTYGDRNAIEEYIGEIDISSFTQSELVDVDFIAYPLVGDSSNILSTALSPYTMPTAKYITHTMVCDTSHTYGGAVAVVDPISGNDSTGVVISESTFDAQNPPNAYLTVGTAANAIRTFNNATFGRNDHGAGRVLLIEGTYIWPVIDINDVASDCFAVMEAYPDANPENVIVTEVSNGGSNTISSTFTMMKNITINQVAGYCIRYVEFAWFHNVDFENTTTYNGTDGGVSIHTHCRYQVFPQGLRGYSTRNLGHHVRGALWSYNNSEEAVCDVFIGGTLTQGSLTFIDDYVGMTYSRIKGGILHGNSFFLSEEEPALYLYEESLEDLNDGYDISNTVIELRLDIAETAESLVWIAGDDSTQYAVNNILIQNVTIKGQRANIAYNDNNLNGLAPAPRLGWLIKNSIFDDINIITDVDPHGGLADGVRIGNHSLVHGCGVEGNLYLETIASPGNTPEFIGIKTRSAEFETLDPKFVDDASGTTGTMLGNGDYHLEEDSSAIDLTFSLGTKYDLDGSARLVPGASGVFELVQENGTNIFNYKQGFFKLGNKQGWY